MNAPTRRAFLGWAQNAAVAAAIGAIGVHFIETAEAMPVAPDLGPAGKPSNLTTQVQWGAPPHSPGWSRPRPLPRRRRWVCWWHRGRRICGWR
jgi:hypothetical protein